MGCNEREPTRGRDRVTANKLVTTTRPGRQTGLAAALGLALGLTAAGALAAAPVPTSTTATITVTNCNNSGADSLREAMANANSGDTIDLSGLDCTTINLISSLVTADNDLTISGNFQLIDGGDAIRPLLHLGTGTLTLNNLGVGYGHNDEDGGCIWSLGNVVLNNSTVKYCTTGDADLNAVKAGGAIWATGNVDLVSSTVKYSEANACSVYPCSATGGGIYAGGNVTISSNSSVHENTASGHEAHGGGIYAGSFANVDDSAVFNNHAVGGGLVRGGGGGLLCQDAYVSNSNITGNTASKFGGGMAVRGNLHMEYSTVANNQAEGGGGAFVMGGVEIEHSTVSGNSAHEVGGLAVTGTYSALFGNFISNSTISGNVASNSYNGSGLYVAEDTHILNSTITANSERNPAYIAYGAGVSVGDGGHIELRSTIVAGNYLKQPNGTEVASDIDRSANADGTESLSGDHNFISYSNILVPADTIGFMQDADLGPLLSHGGPTMTHEPLAGSPVIDAGGFSISTWDQRGTGYDRNVGVSTDIGAIEYPVDRIFADGFGDY